MQTANDDANNISCPAFPNVPVAETARSSLTPRQLTFLWISSQFATRIKLSPKKSTHGLIVAVAAGAVRMILRRI